MNPSGELSTWLEVDLEAIRRNTERLRALSRTGVMAVVKAAGYGHGAAPAARAALRGGAEWLGTARLEEALELRRAGIGARLLVLGHTPPERAAQALEAGVSLTVWSDDHLATLAGAAAATGRVARVHCKVDTGMNRLGVRPEEAVELIRRIGLADGVSLEGAYTHFARADESDPGPTREQERRFRGVIEALQSAGLRPEVVHAANTAGALAHPESRWDLVRSGVGIYGMHPSAEVPLPEDFEPALTWKAALSQVREVPPGEGVSYGHIYVTRSRETLATLAVGYADGFRRFDGNVVLVGGRRVPVVGRVCMDQCLVRLEPDQRAVSGDEAVILGRQGNGQITSEEIAERWRTINYEVTCGITERVVRLYR